MFHAMRHDIRVLGFPLWVLVFPVAAVARIANRGRKPLVKYSDDAIRREWTSMEWCWECARDTLHVFIEFRDEPVVESECEHCKVVREYPDLLSNG